jgi:membrane associated rhomboid family serine protease
MRPPADPLHDAPLDASLTRARAPREPIFNAVPVGVALVTAAILVVEAFGVFTGEADEMRALATFAVVPARLEVGLGEGSVWSGLYHQGAPFFAHQFMHGGLVHMLMNLAMLLQVGPVTERALSGWTGERPWRGAARFLALFLLSGAAGGALLCWVNPGSLAPAVGASGAISGVFAGYLWAALAMAGADRRALRPIVTSAAVFLVINVGLAAAARTTGVLPIAWESHLGGFMAGLILHPLLAPRARAA